MKNLKDAHQRIFFILVLIFMFFVIISCSSSRKISYQKMVRLNGPASVKPNVIQTGSAQACESCMEGNYMYQYRIAEGTHAGDAYVCCVPIDVLARESFDCTYYHLRWLGNSLDQKVQTCLVLDAVSTETRYIRVCIPAPLTSGIEDPEINLR